MSTTNKAGRPRQQTPIPFGLNRYVLIGVACVACVFNGPIVFNWPPLREAMIKSGAFAWKCSDGALDEEGLCVEQRIALINCGVLGQAMMFVGSVFAGAFVDQFGPRLCSLLGAAVFALSYVFLAISSEQVPLHYAAWTLNGLAVEFCFMGLLTIPYLFPSKPKVAMALMGTFRSLSMLYSIGIEYTVKPGFALVKAAWICFALAIFWGAVMFFLLPNRKFLWILKSQFEAEQVKTDLEHQEQSGVPSEEEQEVEAAASKGTWKEFVNRALTFTYLAWLLVFALSYTRGSFYGVSLSDQTPEMTTAFSWASPLSFIPCPFLGFAADYFGMLPVLFFLNGCGTIMFICLLFPRVIGLQWIAVLLSAVLLSFLASQNYCWIAEAYRENVQGKLAGLAMCVAGLVSLVNTPLNSWGTRHNNYLPLNIVFLCISAANFLLLAFMWFNRHTTKSDKEDKGREDSLNSEVVTTEKQADLVESRLPSQSYSSHNMS